MLACAWTLRSQLDALHPTLNMLALAAGLFVLTTTIIPAVVHLHAQQHHGPSRTAEATVACEGVELTATYPVAAGGERFPVVTYTHAAGGPGPSRR